MTCICTCWAVEGKEGKRKGQREGGEQRRGGGGKEGRVREGEREGEKEGERERGRKGGRWVGHVSFKMKIRLFILPLLSPPSLCAGAGPSPGQ